MIREIKHLRKRLKAAKRRAVYWSGRPSFAGFGYSTAKHNTGTADIEYEQALDDVINLQKSISKITGEVFADYDPKADYIKGWNALKL